MITGPQESYLKAKADSKKSHWAAKAGVEQWAPAWAGDGRVDSDISQSLPVVVGDLPLTIWSKENDVLASVRMRSGRSSAGMCRCWLQHFKVYLEPLAGGRKGMTSSTLLHSTTHRLWWSLVDTTKSMARLHVVGQRQSKLCFNCCLTSVGRHPSGSSADLAARPLGITSQSPGMNPDGLRLRSWWVGCYSARLFRVWLVASWGKALLWNGPQGLQRTAEMEDHLFQKKPWESSGRADMHLMNHSSIWRCVAEVN